MTQKSSIPPAFPQQLPRSQSEWQNFLNQIQQAVLSPISAAYKSTTTSLSTTTLTADPDLGVIVPAAGIYSFEALVNFSTAGASGATPGVSLQVNFSGSLDASFTNGFTLGGFLDASLSFSASVNTTLNQSLLSAFNNVATIKGTIQCTTSGTLGIQWAQQNASASAVTLKAGSYLSITRLN